MTHMIRIVTAREIDASVAGRTIAAGETVLVGASHLDMAQIIGGVGGGVLQVLQTPAPPEMADAVHTLSDVVDSVVGSVDASNSVEEE